MSLRKSSAAVLTILTLAAIAIAVTTTPRASAALPDYKDCVGHLNVYGTKGQELTLEHKSTWDTDVWKQAPKERFQVVYDGSYQSHWKSESGYFRGCSATVRYSFPRGSLRRGVFEFYMAYYVDGKVSVGCFPTGVHPDEASCTDRWWGAEANETGHQQLHVEWHLVLP